MSPADHELPRAQPRAEEQVLASPSAQSCLSTGTMRVKCKEHLHAYEETLFFKYATATVVFRRFPQGPGQTDGGSPALMPCGREGSVLAAGV